MDTKKKVKKEIHEEPVMPVEQEVSHAPITETVGMDISEDQKKEVEAVVLEDEATFLKKILDYQHTGGFGRHLDYMIYQRLKAIAK